MARQLTLQRPRLPSRVKFSGALSCCPTSDFVIFVGETFRIECHEWTGGQVLNTDDSDDIRVSHRGWFRAYREVSSSFAILTILCCRTSIYPRFTTSLVLLPLKVPCTSSRRQVSKLRKLTFDAGPEMLSSLRSSTCSRSHRSLEDILVSLSSKMEEVSDLYLPLFSSFR